MQSKSKDTRTEFRGSNSTVSAAPTPPEEQPKATPEPEAAPTPPEEQPKALHFDAASERHLERVTPEMREICRGALALAESRGLAAFQIVSGFRTAEEQLERISAGESITAGSAHLSGRAIDFLPEKMEQTEQIVACIFEAADELKIPVQRGNDYAYGVELLTIEDAAARKRELYHVQQCDPHRTRDFWEQRERRNQARAEAK